jgi:hypothetical protein
MDAKFSHGWTLALVLWGVIAPLIGILVGHYLSRSWQREQWFRDKRYEDYQAVLSATVAAYTAIVRVDMASLTSLFTPEMQQEVEVIKADSFRVLRDRIFIAEELDYGGILVEWDTIVTNYGMHTIDEREFAGRFSKFNDKLVRMALNPPKRPGWFKRWRISREMARLSREMARPCWNSLRG